MTGANSGSGTSDPFKAPYHHFFLDIRVSKSFVLLGIVCFFVSFPFCHHIFCSSIYGFWISIFFWGLAIKANRVEG